MNIILMNTDENCPVKTVHICYYVEKRNRIGDPDALVLKEVVERHYNHPEAPGRATISRTEIDEIASIPASSYKSDPLKILLWSESTVGSIFGVVGNYKTIGDN